MKRLHILTIVSALLAVAIFFLKKREPLTVPNGEGLIVDKGWLQNNPQPLTPAKDLRPADQTFLTFPEWYLVFSPEEQAEYYKKHTASSFSYMSHIAQFWQSYRIVNDQIKDNFPVNKGYHLMIWVIGVSTTVEYSIKSWYETVVGRLTDTRVPQCAEDRFNAGFTGDYVHFIKDRPWYEFDFARRLKSLWSDVPMSSEHIARSIERRYFLSSELLVKAMYGKLIGLGTKTVYDEALPTTAIVLDSLPIGYSNQSTKQQSNFLLNDSSILVYVPRYDRFAGAVQQLARQGIQFKEIAGNNSAILLTVLAPVSVELNNKEARLLFTQPITSNSQMKRIALVTTVQKLSALLKELDERKLVVEHVFDY